jgi:hypothetical protein
MNPEQRKAKADALKARADKIIASAEGTSGERFKNAIRAATDLGRRERELRFGRQLTQAIRQTNRDAAALIRARKAEGQA